MNGWLVGRVTWESSGYFDGGVCREKIDTK